MHAELIANSVNLLLEAVSSNMSSMVSTSTAAIQARRSNVRLNGLLNKYQAIVERKTWGRLS